MKSTKRTDAGLELALEQAESMTKLAEAMGIGVSAISQWKRVPAERVLAVEAATGVPRQQLRPDLYPIE
jgi:DNA-binding transcriptional regulator YdaS (Cro superfamily)